ncbi:hypothetical protein V5E97_24375 [Singulisphaera sp. Ch08]|uniref:Uncharacterized protein n=1 Tax=Singulisphaera sp. Ch08 TaxID=3120278 RepID=A0AAU7C8J0_9BACT
MTTEFKAAEFIKAMAEGTLDPLRPKGPIVMLGMAMQAEEAPEAIRFSVGGSCSTWIRIPANQIEKVEHISDVQCKDHQHPLVQITFREPAELDSAARVYYELIRQTVSVQPTASRDQGLDQTRKFSRGHTHVPDIPTNPIENRSRDGYCHSRTIGFRYSTFVTCAAPNGSRRRGYGEARIYYANGDADGDAIILAGHRALRSAGCSEEFPAATYELGSYNWITGYDCP